MDDRQRAQLEAILARQRETHQRLFDLQGQTIEGLRHALDAVARTQDEMAKLFAHDNDARDA